MARRQADPIAKINAKVKVSVCIANFNGENFLIDCIESVLAQQAGNATEVEIIVHDDASTDASCDLIRSRYPAVRLLASTTNVGFCIANNRMAEAASGDYLLLLNNDAALLPDAIRLLVSEHASGDILSLSQYDWETGTLVDRGCRLDLAHVPIPNRDFQEQRIAYVIGACLWIGRGDWMSLGGFPEWMESIGEDMYLCLLARLKGGSIRVPTGSGYRHRQGASFGGSRIRENRLSTNYRRRSLSERNRLCALIICTPLLLFPFFLAINLLSSIAEAVLLAIATRSSKPWTDIYRPAIAHPFNNIKTLALQRRSAMSNKSLSSWRYASCFSMSLHKAAMLIRLGIPRLE